MMRAPIGVGFLSFAHGHVSLYAEVMRGFDDVRLISGWDADGSRGREVCEKNGMRYCTRIEEVLDDPLVAAVVIGSETCFHEEHVLAAARAGKAILLQKPMALTLEACDRMTMAVEAAGVPFSMAFQMRHDPANLKIRDIVQSGALGDIAVVRRRHAIPVCLMPDFINSAAHWHLEADKNKGMFADDAAHPADWLHWIFGKPVSVMAEIDNVITEVAPDDNGVAIYRFPSGMMATLLNSSTTWAGENTTEMYGSKGVLIQNYGDGPSCSVPRLGDGPALKVWHQARGEWEVFDLPIPSNQGERLVAVPRPWVDSLSRGTPPAATMEDGRVALEMVLGAYQSAQRGRRVAFPLSEK